MTTPEWGPWTFHGNHWEREAFGLFLWVGQDGRWEATGTFAKINMDGVTHRCLGEGHAESVSAAKRAATAAANNVWCER